MRKKPYLSRQRIDKSLLWKDNKPILTRLDMELTERCNNNCIHCYINQPANDAALKQKELLTKEIKDILKEAVSLGCLTVRFTGGEPLLREDFEELYIFSRKSGLRVIIFTNAILITTHIAKLFRKIPPLEKIEITLYGLTRKSYEAVSRVDGSYDAAFRGVNLLLEYKIPFVVKSAYLPCNKNEIDEFDKYSKRIPWMDRLPSYSLFFDLRCKRDDLHKSSQIKRLRPEPKEALCVLTRNNSHYFEEMQKFCQRFTRPAGDKLFSCGAGIGSGCVDAYGAFQLCLELRHPECIYNLKKGCLKNALENFFPKVRELKAVNPEYLSRCARCFLKGLCEQCPGKSWMEHGNLDTPVEYLCKVAHIQARYLGLIDEYERAWEVENWRERIRQFTKAINLKSQIEEGIHEIKS